MELIKEAGKAILAAGMAILLGHCNAACVPSALEPSVQHQYNVKVAQCASTAKSWEESCYCRKAVDHEFAICERWPTEGRCQTDCHSPRAYLPWLDSDGGSSVSD